MILHKHSLTGWPDTYRFYCPACKHSHTINDEWKFNGNMEKPGFEHSVGVNLPNREHYVPTETTCHSRITDGNITFYSDSTHAMAGQTVPLPHFPENYGLD